MPSHATQGLSFLEVSLELLFQSQIYTHCKTRLTRVLDNALLERDTCQLKGDGLNILSLHSGVATSDCVSTHVM